MAYNFNQFKEKVKDIEVWLRKEYGGLRTGQASPSLIDGIMVEAYDSSMPIDQVAHVGIEDAKTLKIAPWDAGLVKAVEKALTVANLGLSIRADESAVRISFPQLTTERRTQLVKVAKEKLEEAKISLRKEREKVLKDMRDGVGTKAGGTGAGTAMTEDDKRRAETELQKLVDASNKELEAIKDKKEKEIMN